MTDPHYIIGIDLGTTNCVVAYTDAADVPGRPPEINIFDIPQLTAAGRVETRPMLPSFVLAPGAHDVAPDALALPWERDMQHAVGEFARNRGAEIPHRLISSTKSWLCNPLVDRNQDILPWQAPDDVARMSPVAGSAALLEHIRRAWNHVMAGGNSARHTDLAMENQEIYLTVPASFDAVARELTIQAAAMAGLDQVTLLEEPQAAFYAWIAASGRDWRRVVAAGDRVLVCDVGGGTSDFSLIRITDDAGQLALERVAVGDHLLVGGDNMDMTLAHFLAARLAQKGTQLDAWQMRGLWHSCRKAKESVMGAAAETTCPVSILGRGSRLIGGLIQTELTTADVGETILDGFFPACSAADQPHAPRRSGIREMGLSYEADPAISRHIARFLTRHAEPGQHLLPTHVLFNGGVMKPKLLRQRVLNILNSWNDDAEAGDITELADRDFDLSVARGAAYYGLARRGEGVRIRGGLGKSYYVQIAAAMPAVPGMPAPMKSLCVAPFGMEEGTDAHIDKQEFVLVVGEPAVFDFAAASSRQHDQAGDVVEAADDQIELITTLETTLAGENEDYIPVSLMTRVTEIGTLELWCVAKHDDRRWKLEFNVREQMV